MSTARRVVTSEDQKKEVLQKIADYKQKGFPEAEKIHELIMSAQPTLCPRLWYGMPGYAKSKDSAVLCFFRKDAYITFGITESVDLTRFTSGGKPVASSWYIVEFDTNAQKLISDTVCTLM